MTASQDPPQVGVSYTELAKDLASAPAWVVERAALEAERARAGNERAARFAPFRQALAAAGVLETYDRATGPRFGDQRIFEIALAHLQRDGYDDWTRSQIARCFEARDAFDYWERLVPFFRAARGPLEREALAAALNVSARTRYVESMMELVRDASLGPARVLLLRPINRLGRARGRAFVMEFLTDPELGTEADRIRRGRSPNEG